MVDYGAFLGIAAVALGLVLTPGPNMMYLVSRSITQGRRAGLISLVGVATGFLFYLLAATAGLVAVFSYIPALYTAVKLAGAGYLLYLAWQAVRPGGGSPFDPRPLPPDSARRLYTMGLMTNLLNSTFRCCRSSSTLNGGTWQGRASCWESPRSASP